MLTEHGSNFIITPERIKTIPLHVVHALPVANWIKNKIGDCTMHVFLRNSGECMLINNLKMRIDKLDRNRETLCAEFKEDTESQTGNRLPISTISLCANIVQIANQCFMVCSLIDDDGRASFYLAVKRDVVVRKSPAANTTYYQAN